MPDSSNINKILKVLGKEPSDNLKLLCEFLAKESVTECCIYSCDEPGAMRALASYGERLVHELPDSIKISRLGRKPLLKTVGKDTELCVPLIPRQTIVPNLERHSVFGEIKELSGVVMFKKYGGNILASGELIRMCESISGLIINNIELFNAGLTASTDKLTGVLNRKYLDLAIASGFDAASKNDTAFSVIMADLDYFKNVNDAFGHIVGDDVLRSVSEILRSGCGCNGIVGRYGGEEFVIVLPKTDSVEALGIAESLRIAVKKADILEGKRDVTVSMGIASYPANATDIRSLMLKADNALYMAKKSGRDKCVSWDESYGEMMGEKNQDFFSGDNAKDSSRITVLFEIMEDLSVDGDTSKKLTPVLKKLLDVVKGASAALFVLDAQATVIRSVHQLQRGYSAWDIQYNDKIIAGVVENRSAINVVDWDNETSRSGIADWQSVIAAPAICGGLLKGILYISVPIKIKEFSGGEISFAVYVASLISAVL